MASVGTLYILLALTIKLQSCSAACANLIGDTTCANRMAVADYCVLDASITPCDCQKTCKAPASCQEPVNTDTACNCPHNAHLCEQSFVLDTCPYTCALWSSVTCDPLISIAGASPLYNGQPPVFPEPRFMDVVTFQCDAGYDQVGSATKPFRRVCNATGQWVLDPDHQGDFSCQRVSCGAVPSVTLATPSISSGVFEDMVTYSCMPGYYNSGTGLGNRTCNASALWEETDADPVCAPVPCGASPSFPNALPNRASGVYGQTVAYECRSGYINSGGWGKKICNASGLWEPDPNHVDPDCTAKPCGPTPTYTGSVASLPFGYYGDIVTYACAPNFYQSGGGNGRHVCLSTGVWTADTGDTMPVCIRYGIRFVNSQNEAQVAPPGSMTSWSARSNLQCASFCARSAGCHGYTFTRITGDCEMNVASPDPVITAMKKVYT